MKGSFVFYFPGWYTYLCFSLLRDLKVASHPMKAGPLAILLHIKKEEIQEFVVLHVDSPENLV